MPTKLSCASVVLLYALAVLSVPDRLGLEPFDWSQGGGYVDTHR